MIQITVRATIHKRIHLHRDTDQDATVQEGYQTPCHKTSKPLFKRVTMNRERDWLLIGWTLVWGGARGHKLPV